MGRNDGFDWGVFVDNVDIVFGQYLIIDGKQ